jgi:hypothetical protein
MNNFSITFLLVIVGREITWIWGMGLGIIVGGLLIAIEKVKNNG